MLKLDPGLMQFSNKYNRLVSGWFTTRTDFRWVVLGYVWLSTLIFNENTTFGTQVKLDYSYKVNLQLNLMILTILTVL